MKFKRSTLDEIEVQLALADKISRLAIRAISPQDVARQTVAELSTYVPIDWASLALIDDETREAHVVNLTGNGDLEEESVSTPSGTPVGWVIDNVQGLLEPNLSKENRFPAAVRRDGLLAVVHMPLIYQGQIYGVISTGSFKADSYGKSQLQSFRHAAAHLAVALKSAMLLEQNVKIEKSLANLSDLLTIITSNPELSEVFPQFAQALKRVVPFDRLSLAHIEGNILRILAVDSETDSYPRVGEVCVLDDTAIPWIRQHPGIDVEEDFGVRKRFPIDDRHLEEGFRGEVRVPLLSHGELFASLHLVSREPCRLKDEMAFLAQLGHYLASPVESYVLYCHEKQRLDWLSALAHNLATPLTPIVSSSELLVEELEAESNGTYAKLARNIYSAAQGMSRNLKAFRDFSEVESADLRLNLEAVDIKPVLSQAVEEAFASAEARSQLLEAKLPESLPRVFADASRVKQILHILLDNSVEASPEKGRIELRVAAEEGKLVLEVLDSATTLSARERDRLLQPYHLSEADRTVSPELSLRMSTCRHLAELHGGSFWLKAKPKKEGNIFGFSLQVANSQVGTTDG